MKKLQQNFTTAEQSKRLLELGVPVDSADCIYYGKGLSPSTLLGYNGNQFLYSEIKESEDYTPCWSVGRLIEIYSIITGRKEFTLRTVDTLINEVIYMLNVAIKHEEIDFSKLEE